MADRRSDFSERDFNGSDLANFDMASNSTSEILSITQDGTEVKQDIPMVTGVMREYSILPGLQAVLLDGAILGAFQTLADMPAGLTIYIGFKANGFAKYGDYSLPHQTLPNILYVYNSEVTQIEQNTQPGPYSTIAMQFADTEFRNMLETECANESERDMILSGLERDGLAHFLRADPQLMESLQSLFTNSHTGIDHQLFVSQTLLGVLRMVLRHILRQEQELSQPDMKQLDGRDLTQIHQAARYIEDNLASKLTLNTVARQVGCSETFLKQHFPRLYGDSLAHYVMKLRMNIARTMLASGGVTIQQVAAHVGYANQASFTTAFRKYHSMTPREAFNACL